MKKIDTSGLRKLVSLVLALSMTLSLTTFPALAADKVTAPSGMVVVEQTDHAIADGVTETDVFLNTADGNSQIAGFMMTVKPGAKATFKASYTGYYTSTSASERQEIAKNMKWAMSKPTDQAKAYEAATGGNVLAVTNGDYFNMQTAQPLGYLIMEGNVVQERNEPYFAVLKDGSFVIRKAGTDASDVLEAISGPFLLLENGQNLMGSNARDLAPRNSIGMKADGTVVTFVADGRQYPYSVGMSLYDQAEFLREQGVVTAIYLDGGGSAMLATKREGTTDLTIRSSPSDGVERTVSSALLLVSTADQDGKFDHASLSPNNQLYTPGSQVQFTATGVDAAGGPADLPTEGLTWKLENFIAGSINETGLFTPADGYVGDVTAQLWYNDEEVGSTTVTLADVTDLSFAGTSISLDFEQSSDLGLTVKCNNRSIQYKDGDFKWTVPETIGSVTNNLFTAAGGKDTLTGTVTVTYSRDEELTASIQVEIGKMPVVLMDFEPDENGPLTGAHYHWGKSTFVDDGTTKGYYGKVSPITVKTSGTYTGDTKYAELTAPYRFTGNWDSDVPAADIFRANGYTFYLWPNNSITTYGVGEVKTVKAAEGPVRFGDYSLQLNYDYASYNGEKNSNFYLRYCGDQIKIDGYPTEVGVWVYVPEGSWEYSMYMDLMYWNGSDYSTKNLQLVHPKNGDSSDRSAENLSSKTDWSGWMYCFADISDFTATYQNAEHPISIIPGQGLFWLSYQPGGDAEFKGRKNGSLYYDNLRLVYGTNLDDLDNPVIESLAINGQELAADGSTLLDKNDLEIVTKFHDVNGANKSGIAAQETQVLIDGKAIENADLAEDSATVRLDLPNGYHVLTVRVYDAFGNTAEKTCGFVVDAAETETEAVTVRGDDFVPLGGQYDLKVVATENIKNATITISNLNSDIGEPTVTYAQGWNGTMEYHSTGYKKAALTLTLKPAENPTGISAQSLDQAFTKTLATITFHIDKTLDTTVNSFTYTVSSIQYTDSNGNKGTSALPGKTLPLSAYYRLQASPQVVGLGSVITVLDRNSAPAAGVTVYLDGTSIGSTDVNGQLATEAMKDKAAGAVCALSADGPGGVAEQIKVTVLANPFTTEQPYRAIHHNAGGEGTQNISWLADPVKTTGAVLRYRLPTDTEWTARVSGESTLMAFSTSKNAARVNSVSLSGLAEGTYEFQVGDSNSDADNDWSATQTFTVAPVGDNTSFFVMGDTQMSGNRTVDADSIAILEKLGAQLNGKDVDFGLQTGDYVDNGSNYAMWEEIQEVFSASFPTVDYIHTLGNHEYYGDATGAIANKLLQLPSKDYYSVEYGDVYVAVINNSADLEEACQWLIDDAAKSDCTWKVLSIHQPPYYTNANGGSERFNKAIPAAADAAGIDVVFSGHDHSYARTPALRNGEESDNGTVYFICGDLGEKSRNVNYAITSDFKYECTSQTYEGLMLYVTADSKTLSVTAYDSADGTIVDSVTLNSPCANGHDYSIYDRDSKMLLCSRCGSKADPKELNYTGWVTVKDTKDQMYFLSGEFKTGWFTLGTTTYHFAPDGTKHDTKTEDTRTCTESGAMVTTCLVCGASFSGQTLWPEGHDWDENHHCKKCGTDGIDINQAELKIYNATLKDPRCAVVMTYNGNRLRIRSSSVNSDGYVTYADNKGIGYGTVTITGCGDYYGTVSAKYKILPTVVDGITIGTVTRSSIDLSWSASLGATNYRLEMQKDGGSWSPVLLTETSYTYTGLTPGSTYAFRVYGYAKVDNEYFSAPQYSPIATATTIDPQTQSSLDLVQELSASPESTLVRLQEVNGEAYLFLPSFADLSALPMTFRLTEDADSSTVTLTGDAGKVTVTANSLQTVDLTAAMGQSRNGRVMVQIGDAAEAPLYIMQSSGIPAMYITSDDPAEGREFVDASKSNVTTAQMQMVAEDGIVLYADALTQLKARGNTTFTNSPKKSYQIKLSSKSDLVGCGEKVKTWVLLAGYTDATQMHDKTFKDLASELGMPYTASCDWVDLFYDGEYRGTYLISEKNSVGKTSVDITDMEDAYEAVNEGYGEDMTTATATNRFGALYQYTVGLTEPEDITGGYLLELNNTQYDEASGFLTSNGVAFNVKSPEWCGQEAMTYISEYYQEFENAVYAQDADGNYTGYNEETGKYYYEYCDLESLVRVYLLQELANNVDGFYSSFFFYKDANGIMYAGPVWDMETTCGTGWAGVISPETEFINNRYLATALSKIPGFMDAVVKYYHETFRDLAEALVGEDGTLAQNAALLADSTAMNYTLWPFVRVGNPNMGNHLWASGTTYADVVNDMISWVEARIAKLDADFVSTEPTEPTEPVEPTEPTTPVGPTEPDQPTIPVGPTQPDQPTIPVGPTQPEQPTEPGEPDIPVGPVTPAKPATPDKEFTDVVAGSYYEDAVKWAIEKGITEGKTDTTFAPDEVCTRGQVVTFLWRAAGKPAPKSTTMPFTDVAQGSYCYDAILWAVENGITKGTTETTFSPNKACSRGEIVTLLFRGQNAVAGTQANPFQDVPADKFYTDAVLWAVEAGVTKGYTADTFRPDMSCNRAQIVTFLWRLLAK